MFLLFVALGVLGSPWFCGCPVLSFGTSGFGVSDVLSHDVCGVFGRVYEVYSTC